MKWLLAAFAAVSCCGTTAVATISDRPGPADYGGANVRLTVKREGNDNLRARSEAAAPNLASAGPPGDPPCAFGPTGCNPPIVQFKAVPKACTVLDFELRVRVRSPVRMRVVRIVVRNRTLIETRRKRFRVRIPARRFPPGSYGIRGIAIDRFDIRGEKIRDFERCTIV